MVQKPPTTLDGHNIQENQQLSDYGQIKNETELPVSYEALRDCFQSDEFFKFQYTVDDLLLAASTAATVFNVLVIFCAFRLFKRNGDTMHIFIINMTLGDLLLTVFCHPNEFLIRKHAFLRHIHLCMIIHYCNWLGLAISGLSLTLLNVDKLIYFRLPFTYERTMSKRRAVIICAFIWAVSLGFVTYVWAYNIVYVTADCMLQMAENEKYYYEIFMIMFCVLPVTSSLVVSTYLFRLARQKRNSPTPDGGGHLDMPTFKTKLKSLVFIFATTVWTSFSLLPYRIFNICRIHLFDWSTIDCSQRQIMNWVAWMLLYLLTLNPIINPLITSIIYAPYRMTLKKLLISFPIGNRTHYPNTRTETESSYFSVRRNQGRRRVASSRRDRNDPAAANLTLGDLSHSKDDAQAKCRKNKTTSLGMDSGIDIATMNNAAPADETNSSTTTSSSLYKIASSNDSAPIDGRAFGDGLSDARDSLATTDSRTYSDEFSQIKRNDYTKQNIAEMEYSPRSNRSSTQSSKNQPIL